MNGGYLPAWIAPSGDLTSYTPTLRERMVDALRRNLFSDDRTGQQRAERVMGLADLTPAGLAPMAYDIGREGAQGNYAGAGLNLAMAIAPMPKTIKNLKGSRIEPPREFFRGTVPGETKRIKTGAQEWDSYLFAADNRESARLYGPSIQSLSALPDAKILYEGTAEWNKISGKWRKDENMLQYANRAAKAAREAGYDAAWFKRQSDIGTAIFNRDKFTAPRSQGIRAFHGSPHDFDRFSMDRIGTGEGAQAYGHGLYFAENEGVARNYRNRLSPPSNPTINGSPITKQLLRDVALDIGIEFPGKSVGVLESRLKSSDDAVNYIEKLKSIDMEGLRKTFPDVAKDVETEMAIFSELERRGLKIDRPDKGRMYEVNINADPNDFLDWDKPLSEQPESVRRLAGWTPEAEAQYRAAIGTDTDNLLAALEGNGNYTEAKLPRPQGALPMDSTGGQIYESSKLVPGDFRDKVAASRALKEAGIPGIKYLDAGSRAKGDGSRNYVVFDDKLITILRKYGLAGLVPAGLLAANQDQGGQQ